MQELKEQLQQGPQLELLLKPQLLVPPQLQEPQSPQRQDLQILLISSQALQPLFPFHQPQPILQYFCFHCGPHIEF